MAGGILGSASFVTHREHARPTREGKYLSISGGSRLRMEHEGFDSGLERGRSEESRETDGPGRVRTDNSSMPFP